jgi:hypothetical protein
LAAGYDIGLVDYLSVEFTNYTFNSSLVDVVVCSFFTVFLSVAYGLGSFLWKKLVCFRFVLVNCSGNFGNIDSNWHFVYDYHPCRYHFCISKFVCFGDSLGMCVAKLVLLLMHGSFDHAIGIPEINIALYSFFLFFSIVELIFALYSFMYVDFVIYYYYYYYY